MVFERGRLIKNLVMVRTGVAAVVTYVCNEPKNGLLDRRTLSYQTFLARSGTKLWPYIPTV